MPLPQTLYVQEINQALYVNRTAEGAAGHNAPPNQIVGVYELKQEVRIVRSVQFEEIPASEKAASAPQD